MSNHTNKARILEAARSLYFRNGIRSVTMDDIAHHMGISKKTLYLVFKDKDKIVTELTKGFIKERESQFTGIAKKSKDSVHEILESMSHVAEMFSMINPMFIYDMQKYHYDSWKQFLEFKETCIMTMIEDNIKKGIREGLYRPELNSKILAKLRVTEVEIAMNPDIFTPRAFSLPEVHVELLDHFLYGISTLKGLKLIAKYKQTMNFKTGL